MTKEVTTPYGVNLWRSIRALWNELKSYKKIKVNNGEKTSFWKDDWHEAGILETLFPDIHNLVQHQQSTLAELWTPDGWDITFRRQVNDWEIQIVAEFFCTIDQFSGRQEEDKLWWQDSDKGTFKVNKAYRKMNQLNQQHFNWPWKNI